MAMAAARVILLLPLFSFTGTIILITILYGSAAVERTTRLR